MSEVPCKNCAFAIYKDQTQVNCELDMIKTFEARGMPIQEVYDDEKEFYVVRACPYFRNANADIQEMWKYARAENKIEQVRKEVKFNYDLIIYMAPGVTRPASLSTTANSLSKLDVKPNFILTINNRYPIEIDDVRTPLHRSRIPYKMEFATFTMNRNECVNLAFTKTSSQFMMFCYAGYRVPNDLINKFHYNIQNIIPFLGYIPKDENKLNGMTFSRTLFSLLGGNTGKTFLQKLKTLKDYEKYIIRG